MAILESVRNVAARYRGHRRKFPEERSKIRHFAVLHGLAER